MYEFALQIGLPIASSNFSTSIDYILVIQKTIRIEVKIVNIIHINQYGVTTTLTVVTCDWQTSISRDFAIAKCLLKIASTIEK